MDLNKVLESFARGEINKDKARDIIHTLFKERKGEASSPNSSNTTDTADTSPESDANEPLKRAFDKMKKSRNFDEFFKASSGIMQQLAGNMPNQIEKLQETYLQDMSFAGLATNIKGITSKFSLFRSFVVSADCVVSENQAVGCQWFAVSFAKAAEVHRNKFTAVQVSEMGIEQSNFSGNHVALSRLSNVTLRKARMDDNRLSRSTLSDVAFADSDFVENRLSKAELAQTVIHSTRMARNVLSAVTFRECDFDGCDIQGIEFENCRFEECSFVRVEVKAETPVKIADRTLVGRTIQDCTSIEALLAALGPSQRSETHAGESSKTSNTKSSTTSSPNGETTSAQERVSRDGLRSNSRKGSAARPHSDGKSETTSNKPTSERSPAARPRTPRSK